MYLKLGGSLADQVRRANPPNELRLPSSYVVGGGGRHRRPVAVHSAPDGYLVDALVCRQAAAAQRLLGRAPQTRVLAAPGRGEDGILDRTTFWTTSSVANPLTASVAVSGFLWSEGWGVPPAHLRDVVQTVSRLLQCGPPAQGVPGVRPRLPQRLPVARVGHPACSPALGGTPSGTLCALAADARLL